MLLEKQQALHFLLHPRAFQQVWDIHAALNKNYQRFFIIEIYKSDLRSNLPHLVVF